MPNRAKQLSYAEAWRRIKAAMENGYHFEAVTLCESVISDRLLSYIHGVKPDSKLKLHSPFKQIISAWRLLGGSAISELADDVDTWRVERNTIVHGLVKSEPGTPTAEVGAFLDRATKAATKGAVLAREVSQWHKAQLRKARHG